jgi:hypothetical protein
MEKNKNQLQELIGLLLLFLSVGLISIEALLHIIKV